MVTGLLGWEKSLASCARAILSFFTPSRCVSSSQSSHCFLVFLCNPPGRDYTEFDVCHVEPGDSTLLRKQDRKNNSETSKSFFLASPTNRNGRHVLLPIGKIKM